MNKGLTVKTGQTNVHKYVPELLKLIRDGKIDPSFVVTYRLPLRDAAHAYEIFREKKDGCIKVVLDPAAYVTQANISRMSTLGRRRQL